jgi:hypothetical protein
MRGGGGYLKLYILSRVSDIRGASVLI